MVRDTLFWFAGSVRPLIEVSQSLVYHNLAEISEITIEEHPSCCGFPVSYTHLTLPTICSV